MSIRNINPTHVDPQSNYSNIISRQRLFNDHNISSSHAKIMIELRKAREHIDILNIEKETLKSMLHRTLDTSQSNKQVTSDLSWLIEQLKTELIEEKQKTRFLQDQINELVIQMQGLRLLMNSIEEQNNVQKKNLSEFEKTILKQDQLLFKIEQLKQNITELSGVVSQVQKENDQIKHDKSQTKSNSQKKSGFKLNSEISNQEYQKQYFNNTEENSTQSPVLNSSSYNLISQTMRKDEKKKEIDTSSEERTTFKILVQLVNRFDNTSGIPDIFNASWNDFKTIIENPSRNLSSSNELILLLLRLMVDVLARMCKISVSYDQKHEIKYPGQFIPEKQSEMQSRDSSHIHYLFSDMPGYQGEQPIQIEEDPIGTGCFEINPSTSPKVKSQVMESPLSSPIEKKQISIPRKTINGFIDSRGANNILINAEKHSLFEQNYQ